MVYDPGWDMPKINWQQQGSYEVGIIPLVDNPDDGPLVCLPPINVHWLPLVLGCLDQLRNPSTWIASDDDAMFSVLSKANRLMQMIGDRAECLMYELRFNDCELQFSTDGGVTWTTVDGWDTGFSGCVRDNVPIVDLPPNPGDESPSQFACSIAAYLADNVILQALTQAISSITDDITLLGFGTAIVDLIPEFVLVTLAYDAFSIIYTAVQEGTISDFEDARDDATLWQQVTCAIFGCIEADGYVKPANFACIVSAIEAISYIHSDVIDTIVAFVNSLGAVGLAQLSQRAGLIVGADCSSCGDTWCYEWSCDTDGIDNPAWTFPAEDRYGFPLGHVDGCNLVSDAVPETPDTNELICDMSFAPTPVINISVRHTSTAGCGGGLRQVTWYLSGTALGFASLSCDPGEQFDNCPVGTMIDSFEIICSNNHGGVGATESISQVGVAGHGVNPFGSDNCTG